MQPAPQKGVRGSAVSVLGAAITEDGAGPHCITTVVAAVSILGDELGFWAVAKEGVASWAADVVVRATGVFG